MSRVTKIYEVILDFNSYLISDFQPMISGKTFKCSVGPLATDKPRRRS